MAPRLANGKICYIEIPAINVAGSAEFYQQVFGWHIRQRGDGNTALDDATGKVSGAWVTGRPPVREILECGEVSVHCIRSIDQVAASCAIYFPGTAATLRAATTFAGNILALTSATLTTGAKDLGG